MPRAVRSPRVMRILSTVLMVLAAALRLPAQQPVARNDAQTAPLTTEQWREDLRVMMARLPTLHANLHHATARTTFDSTARALEARLPMLARHEIIMELARIVALAGDGHSNIYPARDPRIGFHTLPVALYIFRDGLHIRAADRAHAELVGARVIRIGDASAAEAYQRIRPYVGRDNEMGVRFFAPQLLAMPEVLHALRLAPSPDSARLEMELAGVRRTVWLKPVGLADMMPSDVDRSWRHKARWVDARDGAHEPEPLWLKQAPDSVLWWFTPIAGTRAVYAQVNQVRDADTETMESFSRRLLAYLDTANVDRLILDLRLDRGGNGELRMPLMRGLLRQPKVNTRGKLYVLLGRATFSAAQFLLDDLDKYAEVIFVGEPSGSKGNAYGDSRQLKLPNSGITVRASTLYWQDWSPDDPRQWIAPEISAEPTMADYRANHDPALSAALADVARPVLSELLRAATERGDTTGARVELARYQADPAHARVDVHRQIDAAALYFYGRRDLPRTTWLFALAAEVFPLVVRAHMNLAALYEQGGHPELQRRSLERVVALDPQNAEAVAGLRTLQVLQVLQAHP